MKKLEVETDTEFQSFHGFFSDSQEGKEPIIYSVILELLSRFLLLHNSEYGSRFGSLRIPQLNERRRSRDITVYTVMAMKSMVYLFYKSIPG